MATVFTVLATHGWLLAGGVTLLLVVGLVVLLLLRSPANQQRAGDAALVGCLLFVVLACCPLPRWSDDFVVRNEPDSIAASSENFVISPRRIEQRPPEVVRPVTVPSRDPVDLPEDLAGDSAKKKQTDGATVAAENEASLPATPSETNVAAADGAAIATSTISPAVSSQSATNAFDEKRAYAANKLATTRANATSAPPAYDWGRMAAHGYSFGAGLCLAWLAIGYVKLCAALRRATPASGWLDELYSALPWHAGRRPSLFVSKDISRPVCYGVFRPVVVMPSSDVRFEFQDRVRQVLLHELAHAARGDGISRLVGCLTLPLLYFHPLYWWLRRRIGFAVERLADDWAARHSSNETYAAELVAWVRDREPHRRPVWGGASVLRSESEFYRRMASLLASRARLSLDAKPAFKVVCWTLSAAGAIVLALTIGIPITADAGAASRNAPSFPISASTAAEVADEPAANATMTEGEIETADDIGIYDDRPADEQARSAIADVERFASQLEAQGDAARSADLRKQAARWQEELKGEAPSAEHLSDANPEVHMISVYRGKPGELRANGRVDVQVTHVGGPVVLVLASIEATRWNVTRAAAANVKMVLLSGRAPSEVLGLERDVPIVPIELSQELHGHIIPAIRAMAVRESARAIHQFVGQTPATFYRVTNWDGAPIVIGPENAEWRAQRIVAGTAPVRAEAEHRQRQANKQLMADLRFRAIHRVRRGDRYSYGSGAFAASYGEMTVNGAVAHSLMPVSSKLRHVAASGSGATYALYDQQAVSVDMQSGKYDPLVNGAEPAHLPDARTMAFHEEAKKLFVWGEYLYTYDPATSKWSMTQENGSPKPAPPVVAATYLPSQKAIYGLEAKVESTPDSQNTILSCAGVVRLTKFDERGEAISSVELPQKLLVAPNYEDAGIELTSAGNFLIAVRRSYDRHENIAIYASRLFVLDPTTGRVLWTSNLEKTVGQFTDSVSPVSLVEEKGGDIDAVDVDEIGKKLIGQQIIGLSANGMMDARTTREQLNDRFAKIEAAIAETAKHDENTAKRMAADLKRLRDAERNGPVDFGKRDAEPELHLVFVYQGQQVPLKKNSQVKVNVTYTEQPIVLGLLSYEQVDWTLKIEKGVRISKILLSSYRDPGEIHGLESLEQKPTIERFSRDSNELRHLQASRVRLETAIEAAAQLEKATGAKDIAALIGMERGGGGPIEVGPGNPDWRAQFVFYHSKPLFAEAIRGKQEELWSDLSHARFLAIHRVDAGGRHLGPGDAGVRRSFAKFTPVGPLAETLQTMDVSLRNLAVDPWSGTVYAVGSPGVFTVDRDTGKCTPVAVGDKDPPIENASAIAFDAKRKRLMVWGKELHIYVPETKTWTSHRHSGQSLLSACYSAEDDLIYALDGTSGENSTRELHSISRLNSKGALIDRIPLSHRIWLGRYDGGSGQIAIAGGRLHVLIPDAIEDRGNTSQRSPFCYTIDRKTGEVVWSSRSIPVRTKE